MGKRELFSICLAFVALLSTAPIWAQVAGQVTTETALVQKNNELVAEKQRLDLAAQELEQKRLALIEIEKEMAEFAKKANKYPVGSEEKTACEQQLHALEITHQSAKPEYEEKASAFQTEYEKWLQNHKTYSAEYTKWSIEEAKKKEEAYTIYRRQWAHDVITKKEGKESLAGIPFNQLDQKFETWYTVEETNKNPNVTIPAEPGTIIKEVPVKVKNVCKRCGKFDCNGICKCQYHNRMFCNCQGDPKKCPRCGELNCFGGCANGIE